MQHQVLHAMHIKKIVHSNDIHTLLLYECNAAPSAFTFFLWYILKVFLFVAMQFCSCHDVP